MFELMLFPAGFCVMIGILVFTVYLLYEKCKTLLQVFFAFVFFVFMEFFVLIGFVYLIHGGV